MHTTCHCVCHFKVCSPGRWLQLRLKSGNFWNSFHPDDKQHKQRLEWISYKIDRSKMSVLFNYTHKHFRYINNKCITESKNKKTEYILHHLADVYEETVSDLH